MGNSLIADFKDKVSEIKEEVSRTSLHISRIPEVTKTEFLELANSEFEGDYGMTMKYCVEQCNEYQKMKRSLFKKNAENL